MNNKNLQITLVVGIVIGVTILIAAYLAFTGFVIESSDVVEHTVEIEVWANTYIQIESKGDSIFVGTYLDNGTLIEVQEIDVYLDENQILEFQNNALFNLSGKSPGTYSLKVQNQGSPTQYLNPANLRVQIEITESGEIIILDSLETEIPEGEIFEEINETEITFNVPENVNCQEFTESVLWSSGYSNT